MQPLVGELRRVRVVGGDHHHLLAAVAGFGHPVGVRCAGHRHIGTPQHQVRRVPPVARLRNVGLVAEDLRRGDRQVRVPVVEREHRRADQRHEPGADRVRGHRHRRDRGEPGDPVGPVLPQGVHMGGGRDLQRLVPADPHQPALAARPLVAPAPLRVAGDLRPGRHRVTEPVPRLPVHLHQHTARVRVAHPGGGVRVPGERRAARAAPGLVLRPVRTRRRIVRRLCLPGDEPVLDEHLPGTGARAIHPVGGTHHLVVRPPFPVRRVIHALIRTENRPPVLRDRRPAQQPAGRQEPFGSVRRGTFRLCPATPHTRAPPGAVWRTRWGTPLHETSPDSSRVRRKEGRFFASWPGLEVIFPGLCRGCRGDT